MGVLGAKLSAAGRFMEKKLFQCHWITFCTCFKAFEKTEFLTSESQLKIKLFDPPFTFHNLSPKHV